MSISLSKGVGVSPSGTIALKSWDYSPYIVIGGQNAAAGTITYSQTGTTVTVTHAAHAMTADMNGGQIYLTQSTGSLLSGWFTNFTIDPSDPLNKYTCTSTVSQSTSGNLGTNTAETVLPFSYTVPSSLIADFVSIQLGYIRCGTAAATKTLKTYFDSALVDSLSLGANQYKGFTFSASQNFLTNTRYFNNGASLGLTLTTPIYTCSLQTSLATAWTSIAPSYVSYTDRR